MAGMPYGPELKPQDVLVQKAPSSVGGDCLAVFFLVAESTGTELPRSHLWDHCCASMSFLEKSRFYTWQQTLSAFAGSLSDV